MYDGCLRNLDKTRQMVESYKDAKAPNLEAKRLNLEKFNLETTRITEWQRRVDTLGVKAQSLSGTIA